MRKIVLIGEEEAIEQAKEAVKDIDVEVNECVYQEWLASTLTDAFSQAGKEITREESLKLADEYIDDDTQWINFDQDLCEWVSDRVDKKEEI